MAISAPTIQFTDRFTGATLLSEGYTTATITGVITFTDEALVPGILPSCMDQEAFDPPACPQFPAVNLVAVGSTASGEKGKSSFLRT